MVGVVLIFVIGLVSVLFIAFIFRYVVFNRYILKNFKTCNVIVYGKKGTGKDLVFQKVINKRKDKYYSNISYGGKYKHVSLKDVAIPKNTYINFINDKVEKCDRFFTEKKDIYISDIGIFLPSQMDSTLHKTFPSMPIFYALSRHLYNNNIHCNVQNIERGWKALREQADFFINTRYTIKLPFFLITKVVTYEKYQSAIQYLQPLNSRILNKYSKAKVDEYNAINGNIKIGYIIQRKSKLKYNTRAFEKVILKGKRKTK